MDYEMDYKKLGSRVRQQRVLNELTQDELSRLTGVSCSFIGLIERGERKASLETLVALCNALNVSPTLLLQDSLSPRAIENETAFDEENRALASSLLQLLREHDRK